MPGNFLRELGVEHPIILAPMAGSGGTPELVAAVSNAGGLGSWGGAYSTPQQILDAAKQIRALTSKALRAQSVRRRLRAAAPGRSGADAGADRARARRARSCAAGAAAQSAKPVRRSTRGGDRSAAGGVQLHLRHSKRRRAGAPAQGRHSHHRHRDNGRRGKKARSRRRRIHRRPGRGGGRASRQLSGAVRAIDGADAELTRGLVKAVSIPVIASGGIMDGRDIAEMLAAGAVAAQLGTAFLLCPECGAPAPYKQALMAARGDLTVITRAFSGRPARGLRNKFIDMADGVPILPFRQQNDLTRPMRNEAGKQGIAGLHLAVGGARRRARTADAGGGAGRDASRGNRRPLARSACRAGCGRRRGPRHRDSDARSPCVATPFSATSFSSAASQCE